MLDADPLSDAARTAWSFAQLLRWHLDRGTRPDADPATPPRAWQRKAFAGDLRMNERTIRDWLNRGVLPEEQNRAAVERLLFGNSPLHDSARRELQDAWSRDVAKMASPLVAEDRGDDPSLLAWMRQGDRGELLRRLSAEYDAAHPLLRLCVETTVGNFLQTLTFDRQHGPAINHQDFAFMAAPYIRDRVGQLRAMTRSRVTDWSAVNPSGRTILRAQQGKDVRRIFCLDSVEVCELYSATVFPRHAETYGAANVLICAEAHVDDNIARLPAIYRIGPNDDFAVYDDAVVALCSGQDLVSFRTDKLSACREVFAGVEAFIRDRGQSYAELQGQDDWPRQVFR